MGRYSMLLLQTQFHKCSEYQGKQTCICDYAMVVCRSHDTVLDLQQTKVT